MSEHPPLRGDDHEGRPAEEGQGRQTGPLAPSEIERARLARQRGLDAPMIPGGRDPDPDAGLREDRRYGRILLIFVAIIISAGFVLGILANVLTAP